MATTYRKIGKKINRKKGEGGAEFNHVSLMDVGSYG
jgi:hypothetical protein